MKKLPNHFLLCALFVFCLLNTGRAQQGAWQQLAEATGLTFRLAITDGYLSWTVYRTSDGAFMMTKGGSYILDGNRMTVTLEYHTAEPEAVGTTLTWNARLRGDHLQLEGTAAPADRWDRIDQPDESPLAGAWLFAGRKQDGEIRMRSTDGPRKTMKILTGKTFQWIAYNTETGQFFGTGGGAYTAENGKYTEHIEFFSRDNSRVGASLQFDFSLQDGDWHHSGLSSRGQPIYEIWAKRK